MKYKNERTKEKVYIYIHSLRKLLDFPSLCLALHVALITIYICLYGVNTDYFLLFFLEAVTCYYTGVDLVAFIKITFFKKFS